MKYWLITTNKRLRVVPAHNEYAADLAVPDEEVILKREEVFEDDIELFECEVVQ